MTTGGWIFLALSLSFVWGLATFCYWRVLHGHRNPQSR
jgi:hypothetical protein